jgi:hypothetical protein
MPKRVAAAAAGPRKAAKTPAGRDRCDRCRKAIYESQRSSEVNGRCRHQDCWPGYWQCVARFDARLQVGAPSHARFLATYKSFAFELDALREREAEMKALNCVSKAVRLELLALPNSVWPSLALALAY